MSLTTLPTETMVMILSLADPVDIRRCQQVCRVLRDLVARDQFLRYILELDMCGYALPSVPRSDLGYAQKINALRELRERWKRNEPVQPSFIQFAPGRTDKTCFVDGILTYGCTNSKSPGKLTRVIHYHQLASFNKGTEHKHWRHHLGFDVRCFTIQPRNDLIILIEEERHTTHRQLDNGNISDEKYEQYRLHLRTMSTNEPHPAVASPLAMHTLNIGGLVNSFQERCFHLVTHGHLVAILFKSGQPGARGYVRSTIIVYDWVAGIEQVHIELPILQQHAVCFLSHNYLVVPRVAEPYTFMLNERDVDIRIHAYNTLGCLEVYQLPSYRHEAQPQAARRVASFVLPNLQIEQHLLHMRVYCSDSSKFATEGWKALSRHPPKIYESDTGDHLLSMHIRALSCDYRGERPPHAKYLDASGTLFVSSRALLDTFLHRLAVDGEAINANDVLSIPWESWGHCTSWFRPHNSSTRAYWSVEGLRAAAVHSSSGREREAAGLLVLDFNQARARAQIGGCEVGREAEHTNAEGSVSTSTINPEDALTQAFLGGVVPAVPRYTRTLVPMREGIEPGNCSELMVGDEHVVVFGGAFRIREGNASRSKSLGFFVYTR